jgi:BlaI family transcriptional regulator, penicillinase repressor
MTKGGGSLDERGRVAEPPLSRREREVMDIVYRLGRATAAEVRAEMAQPPTDPAVRTTLRILVGKGRLSQQYEGPRFVYTPTVPREAARRSAFRHLVDTFFGGSARGAMAGLLEMEDSGLSLKERRRLRELIDDADRKGR